MPLFRPVSAGGISASETDYLLKVLSEGLGSNPQDIPSGDLKRLPLVFSDLFVVSGAVEELRHELVAQGMKLGTYLYIQETSSGNIQGHDHVGIPKRCCLLTTDIMWSHDMVCIRCGASCAATPA
jgi:hypothetical protein